MAFTPNMNQTDVTAHDKQRGEGNPDPFVNPTVVTAKKPWQNPDGTHKSQSEDKSQMTGTSKATAILKNIKMPAEGEPLDKDTASSTAATTAARAATQRQHSREQGRKERQIGARLMAKNNDHDEQLDSPINGRLQSLNKYTSKGAGGVGPSFVSGGGPTVSTPGTRKGMPGMTPPPTSSGTMSSASTRPATQAGMAMSVDGAGMSVGGKDDDDADDNIADKLFGKSFNSKSMHVFAPLGPYDPFNVQRSASTIPVHSAAATETNQHISRPETVYKSCLTHGISYRADSVCHPCNVYKSTTCDKCGDAMTKKAGGMLACSHGH